MDDHTPLLLIGGIVLGSMLLVGVITLLFIPRRKQAKIPHGTQGRTS